MPPREDEMSSEFRIQNSESRIQDQESGDTPNTPSLAPRASVLVRYLGIYGALWKNSVTRETMFKGNFLLWIVVELLWFALQLCFIGVLFLHTGQIGTWTKWEVVMLIGASHFIQQTFQAFFLVNCVNLSELVRTGKLDFLLLMPVNSRFVVSLRQVDLGAFINAASGGAVMVYAGKQLGLTPSFAQVLAFLALCVAGILIHYSLMFLLATISFWTVRAQGIVWGYYNLFNIARMPDEAFGGLFRALFTFAIPMLLVSNVPVRLLTDKLASPVPLLLLFLMSAVCFVGSELGWRASLRHYTSASS
jgi:ABC-2 type transport system permease protein